MGAVFKPFQGWTVGGDATQRCLWLQKREMRRSKPSSVGVLLRSSHDLTVLWVMQEREMRRPGARPWSENIDRTFYMPTKSDEGVRAFRQWIVKYAGGAPKWAVSVLLSRGSTQPFVLAFSSLDR
jgi:hypothetical protein